MFQRLLLSSILLALSASVGSAAEPVRFSGETMGTHYFVVIDSPAFDDGGQDLHDAVRQRLIEINRQMSTWDPASEISTFNASDSVDWFPVSREFALVVEESRQIHEKTQGAFDPTLSPLIALWGFGDSRPKTVPGDEQIQQALAGIGMQMIDVRLDPPALKKQKPELQLNLSAIAKGYGVDAIAELLVERGQPSFVVDIGGETRTGQQKSTGQPWRIGIESPIQQDPFQLQGTDPNSLTRVVPLTQMSVATSGDYRNFFEIDGQRFSHAIDPTTGRPVQNPPASVSVLHESCMSADAWATALMVLGTERGKAIAEANGLSVLFQDVTDDKTVQQTGTGQFADAAQDKADSSAAWFPFVAAAVLFLLAVGGMSIGVVLKNRELKGSCGGLAAMPGGSEKSVCDLCSIPREECVNEDLRRQMQEAAESSD